MKFLELIKCQNFVIFDNKLFSMIISLINEQITRIYSKSCISMFHPYGGAFSDSMTRKVKFRFAIFSLEPPKDL